MQRSLLAYTGLHRIVEERIERFIERHRPRWIYVDWSGGKDSTAALLAAHKCCKDMVVATFLHLAGQTHVDNVRAVLELAKRLGMRIYRYTGLKRPEQLRAMILRDRPWESTPALIYAVTTANGMDYWEATRKYGFEAPLERFGKGKRWACAMMKSNWLTARPPNGYYEGKPARFTIVGIRRQESAYRARLWQGKIEQVFGERYQREPDIVLAPLADLSEHDVWELLRHYGAYDTVRQQYERWRRAPNCVLCPLAGKQAVQQAISNLPSGYLERVLNVLSEVSSRYREDTFSRRRIDEWIAMIRHELARRTHRG